MPENEAFTQYIADALTSHIASSDENSDFVLSVEGEEIVYVDVEDSQVWLIAVRPAKFVVQDGHLA